MSWKRRFLWIGGSLLAFVLVVGGYGAYEIWVTDGCACGLEERTPLTVYNPFRDRAPEVVATRYLQALAHGNCSGLPVSMFVSKEAQAEACSIRRSLSGWELRSRTHDEKALYLDYGVDWDNEQGEGGPFGIALVRNNSSWQIYSMSTFY